MTREPSLCHFCFLAGAEMRVLLRKDVEPSLRPSHDGSCDKRTVPLSHTGNEGIYTADTLDELAGKIGVDAEQLKAAIDATGYSCLSVGSAPYEKKGLFGRK